jgi:glycosyltransferase involved in cell wall biosynthesis
LVFKTRSLSDVFINGRFLTQRVTGVQRYARETLLELDRALSRATSSRSGRRWILLAPRNTVFPALERIECRHVGRLGGHAWEQLELPRFSREGLLLSFCSTGPLFKKRQIITVHDASVCRVPEAFSWRFRLWYRLVIRRVVARAPRTLAVSNFTASEIVRWFGGQPDRISVTTEGWQHLSRCDADVSILAKHGLVAGRYVLAVSSPTPNKNFGLVLRAAQDLAGEDLQFAIAGAADSKVFAAHSLPESSVKRLGYVSDAQLKALYAHALCFVFPSRYEGFGIPPLEAMSCGCPVIAANIAAVSEVCGGAAEYFDPTDHRTLAAQIRELARAGADADVERSRRRDLGLERAQAFSWQVAAERNLTAVQAVCTGEL